MARVICLKFFLCFLNGWHHPFKIFPAPFKRLQYPFEILPWPFERYLNCFERLEHPFLIHLLAIHQPFVLTVKQISMTFLREWSHFVQAIDTLACFKDKLWNIEILDLY